MTKMSEIPVNDRPIERLLNKGVDSLSNEELLAILLKSGTVEHSAKEIAALILSKIDKISELNMVTIESLSKIKGVGRVKGAVILAALELGKRVNSKLETLVDVKLNNSKVVYEYYSVVLNDKKQEYFYCIYLNNKKKVIKEKLIFLGTINYSLVHPREIFKEACLCSATSILCIHNHPSGNPMPSRDDIEITNKLIEVGKIIGIPLDDHIIIGKDSYYSFFESGEICA